MCKFLAFSSLLLGLLVALTRLESVFEFSLPRPLSASEKKAALRFSPYPVLFDYGIRANWISGDSTHKRIRIPRDLPMVEAYTALVNRFRELGGTLLLAESQPPADRMVIEVAFKKDTLFKLTLVQDDDLVRHKAYIVIVIDDFGNAFNDEVKRFLALRPRVSVAVMPGLKYSQQIAEQATENKLDVLIHMPMEPLTSDFESDDSMLLDGMSAEEIIRRTTEAIGELPQAKGMNNHMGSKFTAEKEGMLPLMQTLGEHDLFFLDSMTNPASVGCAVATDAQVPCVQNNIFLDAREDAPFIRDQVLALAERAWRKGSAVGIGHPKPETLQVLEQELPILEKRGFRFLKISQFVKLKEDKDL